MNGRDLRRSEGLSAWDAVFALTRIAAVVVVAIWGSAAMGTTEVSMKDAPYPEDHEPSAWNGERWNADLGAAPSNEVARYPRFKSAKPLFGVLYVNDSDSGKPGSGYQFAMDESRGTGTGYDRLYIDTNHNRDLSDDKVVKSHEAPAEPGARYRVTIFNGITLLGARMDGSDLGLGPRLGTYSDGGHQLYFVQEYVRQGRVKIGDRTYTVTLIPGSRESLSYSEPSTQVRLFSPVTMSKLEEGLILRATRKSGPLHKDQDDIRGTLSTVFFANGTWLTLSATAKGDILTTHPYEGDMGVIRVSHAGVKRARIYNGVLHSRSGSDVEMPNTASFAPDPVDKEVKLPVGDYAVRFLGLEIGQFAADARRRCPPRQQDEYSESDYFIKVRKDTPYVLEIQSTAEIVFGSYGAKSAYKPGDFVPVRCDLATPSLLFSDLLTRLRFIHPTISIQDSTRTILAEGASLVASQGWQIPKDFVPRGGRETLKVVVTWDTGELFGVVTGAKEIVVESTGG